MCMNVLCADQSLQVLHDWSQEVMKSLGAEVQTDPCEPSCGCRESNQGLPEEQPVLSTAARSL